MQKIVVLNFEFSQKYAEFCDFCISQGDEKALYFESNKPAQWFLESIDSMQACEIAWLLKPPDTKFKSLESISAILRTFENPESPIKISMARSKRVAPIFQKLAKNRELYLAVLQLLVIQPAKKLELVELNFSLSI